MGQNKSVAVKLVFYKPGMCRLEAQTIWVDIFAGTQNN